MEPTYTWNFEHLTYGLEPPNNIIWLCNPQDDREISGKEEREEEEKEEEDDVAGRLAARMRIVRRG
eukprot:7415777-Pyramimonas_sp.AAC.1